MASILDRYGIKEVADVTFYEINKDSGKPERPVLYLDTLKVSTIEQTAENTEARGGKGNAALISWDYNKEINVTLEDALFSAKSMAIMFGDGSVKNIKKAATSDSINNNTVIMRTEIIRTGETFKDKYIGPNGDAFTKYNIRYYKEGGAETDANYFYNKSTPTTSDAALHTGFITYDLIVDGTVIEISANSFPGTYYVTGDTYARSDVSGDDEFFQFIIPKAKVTSENTITLEAEGDPSVFNMNLRVLRPLDGKMMKLVKYDLVGGTTESEASESEIAHNHELITSEGGAGITVTIAADSSGTTAAIEGATQAIYDTDVITSVTFSEGVPTITVESDATAGTTEIKIFDKDGNYLTRVTVTITA